LFDKETIDIMNWHSQYNKNLRIHFVQEIEDSIRLNHMKSGAIVISASGMCDAGRIKYHLKYNLPRPECSILFTGFQAAGTLGRRLVDGSKNVRIFGEQIPVRASVHTVGGLSAHADQQSLLDWLRGFRRSPRKTFIVHGEPGNAEAFSRAIQEQLQWPVNIPRRMASERLG
jgi:metallo-beta-lactamase family protein